MSTQNEITKLAKLKGYFVKENGEVVGVKGNILSLSNRMGYLSFTITYNKNKKTRCFVHKLQAYQKYGLDMFKKGIVVRHKNGISTDNSIVNILIGTASQNSMDIPKEKRILNASMPKYNHEQILKDKNSGLTYIEIMNKHNISSKGTISYIVNKSLKKQKIT